MIGEQLGPWTMDRELGRGGMGTVYHAHAEGTAECPTVAAVKVLAAELAVDPGFLARFQREIDILRKLEHPNIVRFFESGEQRGCYYYAMEFIEGQSYETLLAQQGRLPWPEVLDLALQVTPALKHAHDRGVIHRDLKPSNLLRTPSGLIKLTDFGIASLFASKHLTVTGGIIGTAEYLSPEQAAGKPVTRRSDLYSLGAVLYTLVTGRTPFEGELLDLLQKHRYGQFDRPIRLVPEIPPDLDAIICDLLAKEPAQRPPDGSVLLRRLESLRRKMERKAVQHAESDSTQVLQQTASNGTEKPGPATLMSRLMRAELEQQNKGGPVRRFLHRPVVLSTFFLITIGLIVWTFWPDSLETQYQRGAALMQSPDPDDWGRGWEILSRLEQSDPNHHPDEMKAFRNQHEELVAQRTAERLAKKVGLPGEAQYCYQRGLRLRQQGKEQEAREVWSALVEAFKDVKTEEPWAQRARKALDSKEDFPSLEYRLTPVKAALQEAQRLRAENKGEEADKILRALEKLYSDDPDVQKLLKDLKDQGTQER